MNAKEAIKLSKAKPVQGGLSIGAEERITNMLFSIKRACNMGRNATYRTFYVAEAEQKSFVEYFEKLGYRVRASRSYYIVAWGLNDKQMSEFILSCNPLNPYRDTLVPKEHMPKPVNKLQKLSMGSVTYDKPLELSQCSVEDLANAIAKRGFHVQLKGTI